jgi:hypothetical protein
MDKFARHAHATEQARKFMQDRVAVRFCAPEDGWWKVIMEATHPADPRVQWAVTGRGPDEVTARRMADAEMQLRAYRYHADPAAGLRHLEEDRARIVFVPGSADSVYHVRKALLARGAMEHDLPGALAMSEVYDRLARDGVTVGDLADALQQAGPGSMDGQGRLIA